MVDDTVSQDADSKPEGPSEETKAEQRRTAKERQRRIEATKAALQADVVSAKLDATDRLLRAALTAQAEGETEKVEEAIREHELTAQSIATQAAWRGQVDSMLDDADLDWSDEELAGARVKQEAGDLAGALREVEKATGPSQQSTEERSVIVQDEVRKALVGMGLKVDDGGTNPGSSMKEFTPIAVADLVSNPQAGKESVDEFLTAHFAKQEKKELALATGTTQFLTVGSAGVDVDNFVPELWAGPAIVAREQNLVYARLVDRKFESEITFGDTLHVGSIGNLAARSKTQEGAILFENINESNTDIIIDQWFYSAIAMESFAKVQLNRNMLERYAGKLGYALGLQVDNTLADLPASLAAGTTVGTLAVENTDDELLLARQNLNDSEVPREGRSWVFSPAAETGLMKLDRFIHSDYSAIRGENDGETGLQMAYMGSYYRNPIYITTNVAGTNTAGHNNVLLHTEAFALVMQLAPTTHQMFDIDFIVDKVVMEEIFGTKEMREDHAILVRGA